MELQQLEKEYTVHVYETGPDGRINLHSLLNFMQDIAADHAVRLGYGRDDLLKSNHFWVLSRMYAEISDAPSLNESVIVKTWPSGIDKLFAMRHYYLRYPDGRKIGAGSSSWLIIDRDTKKIQRPDEFLQRYSADNESIPAPVRNPAKLPGVASTADISPPFRVTVNDLDINLHTNNVNYIKWVTDTYDLNFIINHRPLSAEINYLAEAVFGNEIFIRTSAFENGGRFFSHSITRAGDEKELCRIMLEWEKR